jgi:hypothetical protein
MYMLTRTAENKANGPMSSKGGTVDIMRGGVIMSLAGVVYVHESKNKSVGWVLTGWWVLTCGVTRALSCGTSLRAS